MEFVKVNVLMVISTKISCVNVEIIILYFRMLKTMLNMFIIVR